VRGRGSKDMNAHRLMHTVISVLFLVALLYMQCAKNDTGGDFGATDLYGKWKCYKVFTYRKSMPDSIRNSPVDSMNNLFRITPDSILNYMKADSIPCYTKSAMGVEYTADTDDDTVSLNANLIIQAFENVNGITLKYYYSNVDSINEFCLQKIENAFSMNVCDFGNMLLKTTECGMHGSKSVPVLIQGKVRSSRSTFLSF
jgi:hypothetical protein